MLDVGTQVPHGAVRGYVMGERGAKNEPATEADIEAMAAIVREAIEAGALGVSTSRTIAHMAIDGEPVPGTFAARGRAVRHRRRRSASSAPAIFELAPAGALGEDLAAPEREMAWMRKLSAAIGRPVTFALTQNDHDPESWRRMLELAGEAVGRRRAHPAAGRGPAGHAAARPADVPPVRVLPELGRRSGSCRPSPSGSRAMRDPEMRRRLRRRGADARPGDGAVPRPGEGVPARRPAELRARPVDERRRPAPRARAATSTTSTTTS